MFPYLRLIISKSNARDFLSAADPSDRRSRPMTIIALGLVICTSKSFGSFEL